MCSDSVFDIIQVFIIVHNSISFAVPTHNLIEINFASTGLIRLERLQTYYGMMHVCLFEICASIIGPS